MKLEESLAAKDTAQWSALMGAPFLVQVNNAPATRLATAAAAVAESDAWLGSAGPRVDFSQERARSLLAKQGIAVGTNVVHVVYSQGWGRTGKDDAFLLIGNVGGAARLDGSRLRGTRPGEVLSI